MIRRLTDCTDLLDDCSDNSELPFGFLIAIYVIGGAFILLVIIGTIAACIDNMRRRCRLREERLHAIILTP